jgi:hypothetical protein
VSILNIGRGGKKPRKDYALLSEVKRYMAFFYDDLFEIEDQPDAQFDKADIKKCSVDNVYRIAKALGVTVEELLEPYYIDRPDFELFKSNTCHRLKEMGDIDFVIDTLESKIIISYMDRKWYPEAMYLLAMLDYISRENNIPLCDEYDDMRTKKLAAIVYPRSVLALCAASKDDSAKEEAIRSSIPEFLRHNIVESEVRNVI